ncbi:MAG: MerR family transcriptional regulator [Clostridiales bacterium]|nr:MerR family transcriptional regulator [Clostridiales bacterium]
MMTVHEVSKLTGVSIRTLQYYDKIGLLSPAEKTDAGYRLYDDAALERLQQILLFRELEFPLKDIREILKSPSFDRKKALQQQIELLMLKKKHLEDLITFARGIKLTGVKNMDFSAFDTKKIDEYTENAKKQWGASPEFKEFEKKSENWTDESKKAVYDSFIQLFADFGKIKDSDPSSTEAQQKVKDLQAFISKNFYKCSDEVLFGLGKMYAAGGEFTENIDSYGGSGTAEFVHQAITVYCGKQMK